MSFNVSFIPSHKGRGFLKLSYKDWKIGDIVDIYGWDTGTGLQVGTTVDLSDYFTYNVYDVWHKITIPLTDMGDLSGSTIDAIRIAQTADEGKAPKYYLDTIQFEEKTGIKPIEYTVKPELGTWLYVYKISMSLADAYTGTLISASMPALAYNQLLGETALANGIRYQRITNEVIQETLIIKQLSDYLQFPTANIASAISDGTNTFLSINSDFIEPIILKAENDDSLKIVIADDLTGLLSLRFAVGGKVEQRE